MLPDACTDIIWQSGSGALIAGPDTGPARVATRAEERIVGARLAPGVGGAAYGLPLSAIRDQRVALGALGLDPHDELHGELDPRAAIAGVSRLAARLILAGPPDPVVQAAVARLAAPHQRVDGLAADLGLSQRQLRRRMQGAVGYGPKTLQRILRLQHFLAVADTDLARAAAEAGYTDQAHLAHDTRRLTGLTPSKLTQSWAARRVLTTVES